MTVSAAATLTIKLDIDSLGSPVLAAESLRVKPIV